MENPSKPSEEMSPEERQREWEENAARAKANREFERSVPLGTKLSNEGKKGQVQDPDNLLDEENPEEEEGEIGPDDAGLHRRPDFI